MSLLDTRRGPYSTASRALNEHWLACLCCRRLALGEDPLICPEGDRLLDALLRAYLPAVEDGGLSWP